MRKERKRDRVELTLLYEERKREQRTSEGCGSMRTPFLWQGLPQHLADKAGCHQRGIE